MTKAILLLLAGVTAAHAVERPPAGYDRPYAGRLEIVTVATLAELLEHCPKPGLSAYERRYIVGCARQGGQINGCRIIILQDSLLRGATRRELLRHEIAHCNGWKHVPA